MPTPQLTVKPDALRRFRLLALLSQKDLANKTGMTIRQIGRLENGNGPQPIRPSSVRKLAQALKVDPSVISEVVDEVAS